VRNLVSDEYEVTINQDNDVLAYPWQGGRLLANSTEFNDLYVSRKAYDEHGHNICKKKFDINWMANQSKRNIQSIK